MRLEQLVLFGPEDDFRVRFGSKVTVLAGMRAEDRTELIDTLVQAMAGRLPNASVIYVDFAGRRVFADRTGATFAEDGTPAVSLATLLGSDPKVIADLVTLDQTSLGLGGDRPSPEKIAEELSATRATVEDLRGERDQAQALVVSLDEWRAELASLDDRIERSEEDGDRWAWMELRRELDGVRAELAAFDEAGEGIGANDTRLLDAVDKLRDLGAAWAEAGAAAEELAEKLGPLPNVTEEDIKRIAGTPDALPDGFDEQSARWQAAVDQVHCRKADLAVAVAPVPTPADGVVARLGLLDQKELWTAHHDLVQAKQHYEVELANLEDEIDPEVEAAIEAAHLEVLRCERNVQRRFLAGMLGSGTLAVGALLAGDQISVFLGIAMLLASVGLGWWLLAIPRKQLAVVHREEEMALAGANAASWLGLHLRRIDDVMKPSDRRGLNAATDRFATARLDWEELTNATDPDEAIERRELVEAYATTLDPVRRTRDEHHIRTDLSIAIEDEAASRAALTSGLDGYGLSGDAIVDLDPGQLRRVIEGRISAGRFARDTQELANQRTKAAVAAADLQHLLAELGFDDGQLAGRLDRVIDAVSAARRRALAAESSRTRAEVEADIAALAALVEAGRRLSWDITPDPTVAPADPDLLVARRTEVSEMIVASTGPDLADAQRRLGLMEERAHELEHQLDQLTKGPAPLHQRLTDRVARTTWLGEQEECLPVLIDEAFDELTPDERRGVLDLLVRLSSHTQVVILSQDPVVGRWAREHAGADVTLFEADFVPA